MPVPLSVARTNDTALSGKPKGNTCVNHMSGMTLAPSSVLRFLNVPIVILATSAEVAEKIRGPGQHFVHRIQTKKHSQQHNKIVLA